MVNFPKVGEIYEGIVVKTFPNYAILLLDNGYTALLHISEVANSFIRSFSSFVSVGNIYTVKVIETNEETQNIKVSKKKLTSDEINTFSSKKPIEPSLVDFEALKNSLPKWIEDELNKGE